MDDRFAFAGQSGDGVGKGAATVVRRVELVELLVASAQEVAEAGTRCVHVEEDRGVVTRVPERVDDVRWSSDKRAGPATDPGHLRAEAEVDLALEDVEGVGVRVVHVRVGPSSPGA